MNAEKGKCVFSENLYEGKVTKLEHLSISPHRCQGRESPQ